MHGIMCLGKHTGLCNTQSKPQYKVRGLVSNDITILSCLANSLPNQHKMLTQKESEWGI